MITRIFALFAATAILVLAGCSSDDSPVTPPGKTPPPSPDRYVDQATGDDGNDGSAAAPWATISHAVATADTQITIHVAPGTYSAASGETFPITLKRGQTLLGDIAGRGAGASPTRIQGEAAYAMGPLTGTALVGAEGARVAGFSLVNETNPTSYAGIVVDGVAMEIDHNTFLNAMYAGINAGRMARLDAHDNLFQSRHFGLVLDDSHVVRVHNNSLEMGLYGIRAFGVDSLEVDNNLIGEAYAGVQCGSGTWILIHDNTFDATSAYVNGGVLHSGGTVLVRRNTFLTGPGVYVNSGLSVPDVGTAADPGQNDFSAVTGAALKHAGQGTVMAIGNTWPHDPPQVGVDILITGGGSVVTQ